MKEKLPYDVTSSTSIEKYAQRLLNRTLKELLGNDVQQTYNGKGKLGQILEDLYFKYRPNSNSEPDFKEAGVELKTTPIKQNSKGFVSKERLVLNIINYEEEYKNSFFKSSFWTKNNTILLMFYLHEKDKIDLEYVFKIIRLWKFPPSDVRILMDDWNKIVQKIKQGKAHELSEGDTFYLGACTKGANKKSLRKQPFSSKMAMQRAFSIKSKYLNFIIAQHLNGEDVEPIVKDVQEFRKVKSFEELVIGKFEPFYGHSEARLIRELNIPKTNAKSKFYLIAKAILGVTKGKIEEFEKADVLLKTIRLEKNGTLRESMSFAQIQFKEIINESWQESYWYETLTKRFFFVVFQRNAKEELCLKRVMFWTMPQEDLRTAGHFWLDTKRKILRDEYDNFIKISDDRICHVRPKGADSNDLMETPSGRMERKKCYWLNASYIKRVISE